MTNTIPENIMQAIKQFRISSYNQGKQYCCSVANEDDIQAMRNEVAHAYQALLTVIAAHLRSVVPVEAVAAFKIACIDWARARVMDLPNEGLAERMDKAEQRLLAAYQPTTQPNESSALPDVGDEELVEMVARAIYAARPSRASQPGMGIGWSALSWEETKNLLPERIETCLRDAESAIKAMQKRRE